MTAPDKNTTQYQENTISSARPEDLALMMYNGLMKFIARAQEEIRGKLLESAHNTLIRCQDIVFEFQYTLNMDYSVSNNLMLLYDYLYNRLIEANAKKDCEILDEVLGFVTELRDTWVEAVRLNKELKAAVGDAEAAAAAAAHAAAGQGGVDADGAEGRDVADQDGAGSRGNPGVADNASPHDNSDSGAGIAANAVAAPAVTEVQVDGASVRIGNDAPIIPRTKAIYKKAGGVPVGYSPAGAGVPKMPPPQPPTQQMPQPQLQPQQQMPPPQATPTLPVLPPQQLPPQPAVMPAPTAISDNGNAAIPDTFEQAAQAARVLNNPLNRIKPSAAAQYAKVSKAKTQIQENISIASE